MTRESLNRVKRKLARLTSDSLRRVDAWLMMSRASVRRRAFEATLTPPPMLTFYTFDQRAAQALQRQPQRTWQMGPDPFDRRQVNYVGGPKRRAGEQGAE